MSLLLALNTRLSRTLARWRSLRLLFIGVETQRNCRIARGARIARTWLNGGYGSIALEVDCEVREHAVIESWGGRVHIGPNTFIGPHAVIYGHGGVEIGRDVLISMHVCILSSNHTMPSPPLTVRSQPDVLLPTLIGNDVWIGANAVVLGGVTIGDRCVVGAGAVVTNDLPPCSIAVGIPARVIRQRR